MTSFVLTAYFTILVILCVYGGHRLRITHLYRKYAKREIIPAEQYKQLPRVTIQLPVYNEKFVIERLIAACVAIDYPANLLQIQVLDDSTDETARLAAERVKYYRERGCNIEYVHRVRREGFKAGALENGLKMATGELIAIFDADFVPQPDILRQTVDHFTDPEVGMVQTRWDHLNRDWNTLTRVEAVMLDAHFVVEHGGRCNGGLFFNFNGTAGIWRRQTIIDAGGWQHDTLTEDLDLSYRAQLRGWRFVFLPHVVCPAELPADLKSFKSQQHRWSKGAIQVMLKLMPTILKSRIPFRVKLESSFHLSGNFAYLLMVINSLFFVIPSMMLRYQQSWWQILLLDGPLFLLASVSFIHFYLTSQKAIFGRVKGKKRLIPAIMAVGIGMGINNARAVVEALFGISSGFIRTPKAGTALVPSDKTKAKKDVYHLPRSAWGYVEIALGFMYSCAIVWAITLGNWASIPFLVLFQNGFYFVGWLTLLEDSFDKNRPDLPKPQLRAA